MARVDELIVGHLQGRTTPEQDAELARWRASSPEHEARFRDLEALWVRVASPVGFPTGDGPPTLAEMEARRVFRAGTPGRRPPLPPSWRALGRAAAVLAAMGAGYAGGVWSGGAFSDVAGPDRAVTELRTGPGELASATLPDGTTLRLGPETVIRATVDGLSRSVHVEGQAFLAVASDSTRPFLVQTLGGEAQVLGTRFQVDARAGDLRLAVVEGRVAVKAAGEEVQLRAGEQSLSSSAAGPRVEAAPELQVLLSWMGSFVAFESTPLREVARELGARLGIQILFSDPALGVRTVTGWFDDDEPAEVLELICRAASVACRMTGDTLRIDP